MQTRRTLKRSALALAISMAAVAPLYAQSNSQGYIFGQVNGSGTVVVENLGTGQKREIAVDADGNFRASALPIGRYRVEYDGQSREVAVSVGTGTPVGFTSGDSTLAAVTVTGRVNPIDISSVESSSVLTEAEIDAVPINRNVTGVALLAPGTVRGDNAFGNLASFGGASVAENAYFINGFNVTNILNGLAFSELPFEAIAEQQTKTGGYGAEFGRSLGGVINIVTKRGSNDWDFGASMFYTPGALAEATRVRNRFDEDGQVIGYELDSVEPKSDGYQVNLYGSGPLIEDRLFFFGLVQTEERDLSAYNIAAITDTTTREPQALVKLDWNITDNHIVELTAFQDKVEADTSDYALDDLYSEDREGSPGRGQFETGGKNYILKWTGYLSDGFTLSAMAGRGEYSRGSSSDAAACPFAVDARISPRAIGCYNVSFPAIQSPDVGDTRTAYRIDADWLLGDHSVRFGIDREEFETVDFTTFSGGIGYRYITTAAGRVLTNGAIVPEGVTQLVRVRNFENGGTFTTLNNAWYLEDTWQATDRWVVYGGLRNEGFENRNSVGGTFVEIANTWAPRIGAAWDVKGDGSLKLFGNAGRYFIPVYANTNVRLAGAENFWEEFYTFSAIDPVTGAPTLGTEIGDRNVVSSGEIPDPRTVVDNSLDPLYQDEFIIGFQKQIAEGWSLGVRATHRDLGAGMDDYCSYSYPAEWALANGYSEAEADAIGSATNHCFLMNPGQDLDMNVDLHGDGNITRVLIPAAATGLPAAVRKYNAAELFFERAWDSTWFLKGSWTIAHGYGNTEGYVKSDNGQGDAGITQDFDHPGLADGAYGDLPNDRRHSLKLFGAYKLNDAWELSSSINVQSGRPRNCFGIYAGTEDPEAVTYGPSSFYCDTTDDGVINPQLTPRGTAGRNPWSSLVNLGLKYSPQWATGLSLEVDVTNLFNTRKNLSTQEVAEDSGGEPRGDYLFPTQITAGRQVRFGLQYDF
ncbi:MAG: TonB-dependent receptor [Rhodanobacteraceae bacterium]|nr:TonB-dependent receptor [Rhodanobacteraceae bacterium]